MMGYPNDGELAQNAGAATNPIYAGQTVSTFNATLRHEIGHAVDNSMGIMKKWQAEPLCGAWQKHATYTTWVDE
ncbi:MAG: putative Zn-dependent protease [Bradymonadia bacterium]|jgi:predicted Zn-dependent protease